MRRSHVALLLVLGAPVALYAAVLVPRAIPSRTDEPTSPAAYFPTAVGTKGVYEVTYRTSGRSRVMQEIEWITAVTDAGGERVITVKRLDDPEQFTEWVVSDAGIRSRSLLEVDWRRPESHLELESWYPVLPARLVPGERWTSEKNSGRRRTVCTVTGWETVRVPAGAYKALRVDVEFTEFDRAGKHALTFTGAQWHAPGVGLVKTELTSDIARFRVVRELRSFSTPPSQ